MPYTLLEDEAIADICFVAEGKDIDELFASAAQAYLDISANPKTVKEERKELFTLSELTVEKLLFSFLGELIFIRDSEFMNFSRCEVEVKKEGEEYMLHATVHGTEIDEGSQELRNDVKAVTMHMFSVKEEGGRWKAKVVLDI